MFVHVCKYECMYVKVRMNVRTYVSIYECR